MNRKDAYIGRLPDNRYAAVSLGAIKFCFVGDTANEVEEIARRAVAFARQVSAPLTVAYESELVLEAA
jgi:hypothetical protein